MKQMIFISYLLEKNVIKNVPQVRSEGRHEGLNAKEHTKQHGEGTAISTGTPGQGQGLRMPPGRTLSSGSLNQEGAGC